MAASLRRFPSTLERPVTWPPVGVGLVTVLRLSPPSSPSVLTLAVRVNAQNNKNMTLTCQSLHPCTLCEARFGNSFGKWCAKSSCVGVHAPTTVTAPTTMPALLDHTLWSLPFGCDSWCSWLSPPNTNTTAASLPPSPVSGLSQVTTPVRCARQVSLQPM